MSSGARGLGRSGLDEAERECVAALGTGRIPPFLGHHELPGAIAQGLSYEIRRGVGRIEARLRLLFYLWPALTITWIARTVAECYGSESPNAVHPILASLLGVDELDPDSRRRIAELFRHACRRLDLPFPGAGSPPDLYVVQGGVPHSQIPLLVDALTRAERRIGLPDIDDDMAVAGFTERAADLVDVNHPRLRKVLEHDTAGWYARLWTLLRQCPDDLPDDVFTSRLAEAAARGGSTSGATLVQPCLAWRDGLLGIDIPAVSGRRWVLSAPGWRQEVAGQTVPVTIPLPLPWPSIVDWRCRGAGQRKDESGSLEPPSSESVAVFAANGRLVAKPSFDAPKQGLISSRMARGLYDLLSVSSFLGPEGIAATRVPGGAHLRVELGDEAVALYRGARTIVLSPVELDEIDILGPVLRDLHGRAIHTDQALRLRVRWPRADMGGEEPIEAAHEVLVEVAGQTWAAVPIRESAIPEAVTEVGPRLRGSASALRRVVFKLVRRGERRALARAAGFVWVGLQPPLQPAFAGRRPANLVASACAHLDLREDRVALPVDTPYAVARLVVDDVDGRGRRETFEFAYPRTLAMLRWIDLDGVRREQILENDAIVVIRPGDARLLEVFAPDAGATLIVGAEARPGAFADGTRVGIPLATVAEACRGGVDRLVVRGADGSEIALARFTVPCDVGGWVEGSEPARDERSLLLAFREPLDQLRVCARDLWHGRTTTIELAPDGMSRRAPNGIMLRLQPDHSAPGSRARLVAEIQDWPAGLWLCKLDARLGDDLRWQPLSNSRGDSFAWLVSHGLGQLLASDLTATLPFAERIQIFARCHKVLQGCFAQPCWDGGVDSVLQLWRRLARAIAADPRLTECWPALLPLAFIEPPLEASESWLPLASFWDALPEFMSVPGACYAHVREINRDDTAVPASLADLADAGSVSRFLQRWRLDTSFFSCFANLGEVDRTEGLVECRGFHLGHYTQGVRRAIDGGGVPGWSPDDGMLSPAHWLSAFESLRHRYHMLTGGHGNAERIPGAARLVHDAIRWLDRDGRGLAEAVIPDFVLDGAALALPTPVDEDEDTLLQDAPAALCAIALACRVGSRRPGALDAFINVLAGLDRDRTQVSADLNFLTAAGRDLFAFWLLFWEVLLTTGERCRT